MHQGPAPAPTTTACGWQKLGCHGWQHPCRLGVSQYNSRILRGGQCRPHSRARVRRPMVDTSYGASNHGARAARWAQLRGAAFPFHSRTGSSRCGRAPSQGAGNLGRSTRGVCDDARYPPPVWSGVRERACGRSTTNPRSCELQGDRILAGSNRTDQLPPCDSSTHLVQPMLQAPARRPHRTTLHFSRLPATCPFPFPERRWRPAGGATLLPLPFGRKRHSIYVVVPGGVRGGHRQRATPSRPPRIRTSLTRNPTPTGEKKRRCGQGKRPWRCTAAGRRR